MKRAVAPFLLALLAGCAYGPPPGPGIPGPVAYDGYYDDYYGPFYDGYWAGDGAFYYSTERGRPFVRDEGHHFRREGTQGFHAVHGLGGGGHVEAAHPEGERR